MMMLSLSLSLSSSSLVDDEMFFLPACQALPAVSSRTTRHHY